MVTLFHPASPQTAHISAVFTLVCAIAAMVLLAVTVTLVYSVVRYRSRGGESAEPQQIFGSQRLELLWTVVPILIMAGLFIVTVRAMVAIDAPQDPNQAADLIVTGHQWWWDARYPNGAIATEDLHIPVSRRLLVRVESSDVIHDFWAPDLARKMDAVPGRLSFVWLEADRPGTYTGACSEFCGAQHAWMRFRVMAEPEPEFDAWLRRQALPPAEASGDAAIGAILFQSKKCADCHEVTGLGSRTSEKGPNLAHLATRALLGGGIQTNTPANLSLWLTDPQQAKPGNRMPNTALSPAEVRALLAYLENLR